MELLAPLTIVSSVSRPLSTRSGPGITTTRWGARQCKWHDILYAIAYLTWPSDSRIPALIRNGIQEKKRSFFVVVGDRPKDAIVHRKLCPQLFRTGGKVLWPGSSKLTIRR